MLADWKYDFDLDLGIPPGRLPLMWCLIAFLSTFLVTRTIVRYIRHSAEHGDKDTPPKWWHPRNFGHGSLRIHHVVIGVILVLVSGITMVTLAVDGGVPESTVAAIFFGIGGALVLDEFALILHLQDVYWSEDGRTSVDAVLAAVAVAGLLIGLVGMFITPLLLFGAIRLSRPHAPWARWRYAGRPKKMHRGLERERRLRRPVVSGKLWLQHVIAGEPRFPDHHEVSEQLEREIHAAPTPRIEASKGAA